MYTYIYLYIYIYVSRERERERERERHREREREKIVKSCECLGVLPQGGRGCLTLYHSVGASTQNKYGFVVTDC